MLDAALQLCTCASLAKRCFVVPSGWGIPSWRNVCLVLVLFSLNSVAKTDENLDTLASVNIDWHAHREINSRIIENCFTDSSKIKFAEKSEDFTYSLLYGNDTIKISLDRSKAIKIADQLKANSCKKYKDTLDYLVLVLEQKSGMFAVNDERRNLSIKFMEKIINVMASMSDINSFRTSDEQELAYEIETKVTPFCCCVPRYPIYSNLKLFPKSSLCILSEAPPYEISSFYGWATKDCSKSDF